MSRRTIVLLVSVALAAVAAFSVWSYITTVESNVRANITEVVVFRATQPIAAGKDGATARASIEPDTALKENVVFDGSRILCRGPVDAEAPGADRDICDNNPSDLDALLQGNVSAGPISTGQLITSEMFVAPTELDLDKLSVDIPQGKVAIAISPGNVGSIGGFLRPSDRVNVLATFTLDVGSLNDLLANPDTRELVLENTDLSGLLGSSLQTTTEVFQDPETGEIIVIEPPADPLSQYANSLPDSVRFTQTILQDVVVIAFGTTTRTAPGSLETGPLEGEPAVVLEVTPSQAEVIEFARQNATLALSLLPAGAPYSEFTSRGTTVDDVFSFVDRLREQLETLGGS